MWILGSTPSPPFEKKKKSLLNALLDSSHVRDPDSGYLGELIRDDKEFKRSCKERQKGLGRPNWQKGWFLKETAVFLTHFFQVNWRNCSSSELLAYKGALCSQKETIRTLKKPSGILKRDKNSQKQNFQRRQQSWRNFFMVNRET